MPDVISIYPLVRVCYIIHFAFISDVRWFTVLSVKLAQVVLSKFLNIFQCYALSCCLYQNLSLKAITLCGCKLAITKTIFLFFQRCLYFVFLTFLMTKIKTM